MGRREGKIEGLETGMGRKTWTCGDGGGYINERKNRDRNLESGVGTRLIDGKGE